LYSSKANGERGKETPTEKPAQARKNEKAEIIVYLLASQPVHRQVSNQVRLHQSKRSDEENRATVGGKETRPKLQRLQREHESHVKKGDLRPSSGITMRCTGNSRGERKTQEKDAYIGGQQNRELIGTGGDDRKSMLGDASFFKTDRWLPTPKASFCRGLREARPKRKRAPGEHQ